MKSLELWAKEEFLTVPQLTRVVVKKAIAEYLKQRPPEAMEDTKTTQTKSPTKEKPTASKTKRKPNSKSAS
jgi:hypothetical protein